MSKSFMPLDRFRIQTLFFPAYIISDPLLIFLVSTFIAPLYPPPKNPRTFINAVMLLSFFLMVIIHCLSHSTSFFSFLYLILGALFWYNAINKTISKPELLYQGLSSSLENPTLSWVSFSLSYPFSLSSVPWNKKKYKNQN